MPPSRRQRESGPPPPWRAEDVLPNAVLSASWEADYAALAYDHNDGSGIDRIPPHIITATLEQPRFAIVLWQPLRVTFVDVSHMPARTFAMTAPPFTDVADWSTIKYYERTPGLAFVKAERLDPREVVPSLDVLLRGQIGATPEFQGVVPTDQPIQRLLIEYPRFAERDKGEFPLDTTIALLGGLASHHYINGLRNPDTLQPNTEV